MPLARVCSPICREGVGGDVGRAAADARLDQLDQGPGEETEIVVLAAPLGGGEGGLIVAEAVVEHRGRVLGRRRSLFPRPWRSRRGRRPRSARDAPASWPRQAASTIEVYPRGALPVAFVIAHSASSISAAAAANSPAWTCTPAR